ncbi:MAG TPA: DUF6049 family protein [Mycobacteriales bacterium]|nr:DUF6049 family protein [Mycobacteriales bacterium]
MSRRRANRAAAALGMLLALPAVAVPVTHPPVAAAATTAAVAPEATEITGPVQITVDQLTPVNIRRGDQVTVVATLVNNGTATLTDAWVRLRTASVRQSRSALADADANPPAATHGGGDWLPLSTVILPGHRTTVRYQTTTTALRLTDIGVYPAELAVEGDDGTGAGRQQVGSLWTYLPYFPHDVTAPTQVTWLLPFVDRPRRLTEDDTRTFLDDQLAASIDHGRLRALLDVALDADAQKIPFSLAVDPDLVDSVAAMKQGYRVQLSHYRFVQGTGKQAAAIWLHQLGSLAARHQVIALPYGDADVVALDRVGLGKLAEVRQETVDRLSAELADNDVPAQVETRVAWPPEGLLTDRALDAVVAQGARAVVLAADALPNADRTGSTQSATSPLPSGAGTAVALVADAGLAEVVAESARLPGGPRVAEQRYLAELAMITAERPSISRRLLVAPPRRWEPDRTAAAAMLLDTATRRVPYLAPGTVPGLIADTDRVPRGELVYPRDIPELTGYHLRSLRNIEAKITDFRGALDNAAANRLVEPFTHAMDRAASSAWRDDAAAGAAYLARVGNLIVSIRHKVYVVVPQPNRYTLGGQNSRLPVTIVNELDAPVRVRVQVESRGAPGFSAHDLGMITLEQASKSGVGKRTFLQVPVTLSRAGRFEVKVSLVTPDGQGLSGPITLQVQSTAYGVVALGITGAAFVLLLVLVARRMIRRPGYGPRPAVPPAGSPAERGL